MITVERRAQLSAKAKEQWASGSLVGQPASLDKRENIRKSWTEERRVFSAEHKARLAEKNRQPERRKLARLLAKKHLMPFVQSEEGRARGRAAAIRLQTSFARRSGLEARAEIWFRTFCPNIRSQFVIPEVPHFVFDFAIPSRRILIEVDGCYWHGCKKCGYEGAPKTLRLDKVKTTAAESRGWMLIRVKEHALKGRI